MEIWPWVAIIASLASCIGCFYKFRKQEGRKQAAYRNFALMFGVFLSIGIYRIVVPSDPYMLRDFIAGDIGFVSFFWQLGVIWVAIVVVCSFFVKGFYDDRKAKK